jgi:hypothetical protein
MRIHETKNFQKVKTEVNSGHQKNKFTYKIKSNFPDDTSSEKNSGGKIMMTLMKTMLVKKGFDKTKQDITEEIIHKPVTVLQADKIIGRPAVRK